MSTAILHRIARPCGRCSDLIAFARTLAGKSMPIDVLPDPAGNVAVYVDGGGQVLARVVTAALPVKPHERLHMPHFATCSGRARAGAPS